jgi:hypothetical protein
LGNFNELIVYPSEVERAVIRLQNTYSDFVEVNSLRQFNGLKAYAISISNFKVNLTSKRKAFFSVPHAHEPAGTAACMKFIEDLLEDRLENSFTRKQVLEKTILIFNPDGNPSGRSRAPEKFWDGSKYNNEEFLDIAFGIDSETGKRMDRLGRWNTIEKKPSKIGIVYEQINEKEYVEPNRDQDSTYFKLAFQMMDKYNYDLWLDLHQTEFENSPYNASIILSCIEDQLPEKIREFNYKWGLKIINAWSKIGNPDPRPKPLGYTGKQREYFIKNWSEIHKRMPSITTEVQNNNVKTPPEIQVKLQIEAIKQTVEMLLEKY